MSLTLAETLRRALFDVGIDPARVKVDDVRDDGLVRIRRDGACFSEDDPSVDLAGLTEEENRLVWTAFRIAGHPCTPETFEEWCSPPEVCPCGRRLIDTAAPF